MRIKPREERGAVKDGLLVRVARAEWMYTKDLYPAKVSNFAIDVRPHSGIFRGVSEGHSIQT